MHLVKIILSYLPLIALIVLAMSVDTTSARVIFRKVPTPAKTANIMAAPKKPCPSGMARDRHRCRRIA